MSDYEVPTSFTSMGFNALSNSEYEYSEIPTNVLYGSLTTPNGFGIGIAARVGLDITVPGAALGDFVLVSASADLFLLAVTCYVQAANTVRMLIVNGTGANVNLGNVTFYARVIKRNF